MRQFIPATSCSFFAAAITYTSTNATILLTKINRNTLDTIRTNTYYDGIYSYSMNSLLKFHDNKYFLVGNKFNSSGQWPCVFHLDSNLNIVSSFTLSNPNNYTTIGAFYDTMNYKIVLTNRKLNSFNGTNVTLLLCDTLLNGLASNTYSTDFTNSVVQVIYSGYDNCYITIGALQTSIYANNYSMFRIQLCKYDANLNTVWRKIYGSATIQNHLADAVVNADGAIVACGIYSDSTSLPLMNYDTKGAILKTNANGDSLWMRQYNNHVYGSSPANYLETFYGIENTLDGGYILCGSVSNQPQNKAWIVKTDSLGCVSSGCGSVITDEYDLSANTNQLRVVPNPARDYVDIEVPENVDKEYFVQIQDITGKIILELKVCGYERIDVSPYEGGIYIINLLLNSNMLSSKKLVIIK